MRAGIARGQALHTDWLVALGTSRHGVGSSSCGRTHPSPATTSIRAAQNPVNPPLSAMQTRRSSQSCNPQHGPQPRHDTLIAA